MKFLTVAAAIFASTSLAVPTNPNAGGACVPNPHPGHSSSTGGGNTSTGPGGNTSTGPATSGPATTGPATTTSGSNTGSNTSPGPATTNTGNPPNGGEFRCPAGLYSNLECCSADVLGVLDLDCKSPSRTPTSGADFKSICAAVGKQAKCCVLPVAGQAALCQDVPGGGNPTGGNPTGGNPTGGNPTTSGTGGNPTTGPGGNPTGGNPTTSATGGNPTSGPGNGGDFHCPAGLYSNPQCCSAGVLGVAGLDCGNPSRTPTSGDDFKSICAASGKKAQCCVLPVAGQAVLCQDAIGGGNPPGGNPPGGNPPGGKPPGGNPTTKSNGGNPTTTMPNGGNPTTSSPAGGDNGPLCPKGLISNPQCCAVGVLGVADLDCETPRGATGPKSFGAVCAAKGKQAACCAIPVAGQALLCQKAIGA
ncbi:hypothetical protein PWT90_10380 [Aphanocladium album]|nr:hypothetical protein PWT90_10380 [Aphanocladium album]